MPAAHAVCGMMGSFLVKMDFLSLSIHEAHASPLAEFLLAMLVVVLQRYFGL